MTIKTLAGGFSWYSSKSTYFHFFAEIIKPSLYTIKPISRNHGVPCMMKSNQSRVFIPTAPPMIHFTFPNICGSGKNGARPRVRLPITAVLRKELIFCALSIKIFISESQRLFNSNYWKVIIVTAGWLYRFYVPF